MPLTLVRSNSNRTLWSTCADRFLEEAADTPGPRAHRSHIWLTQRHLRDLLLEQAHRRGLAGWLAPPISFFSDLPRLLGIESKPLGLLARRRLVGRIADEEGRGLGIGVGSHRAIIQAHVMDGLLSELLPEGISPAELDRTLEGAEGDEFARRRNAWVAATYRRYAEALGSQQIDPRSIHALLAHAVDGGALPAALGDARRLHVYGLYTLRSRRRLVEALARQTEVEVFLYTLSEPERSEWDDLADALGLAVEDLPAPSEASEAGAPGADQVHVQPAPDPLREARWIAAEVKRRLAAGGIEPHEICVVSRTGREDTRVACDALRAAGVPCSARQRIPLAEIGALRALLELFRGAAAGWTYRPLRNVLASPYFDIASLGEEEKESRRRIDLRGMDFVARERRMAGLREWAAELEAVADRKDAGADRDVGKLGVPAERMRADAVRLRKLADVLEPLAPARSEREWVATTLELVRTGVLGLRRRACTPVGERWELVRFDQRGLRQLEALLADWGDLLEDGSDDEGPDAPGDARRDVALSVSEWHHLLSRLLETHELALSTPAQKGVQVLEAHDAALIPFRAVFVLHANDGEFPQAPSTGGVFLEEERTVLRGAGLPVADRELTLRRERTLWRAVAQGQDVTISYRTTDAEGRPLLASLMVPAHDQSRELPRSFEPLGKEPTSVREQLRSAAAGLRRTADSGAAVETPEPAALRHAVLAAYGETARGARDASGDDVTAPNPWHGQIRDPAVLAPLEELYGDEHVWSASQLESYATCPFLYLTDRVLRLTGVEEAEEDATPLTFGGVAHDVLQRFYEEAIREGLPPALDPAAYGRIAEEVLSGREGRGEWLGLPVLWRYKREEIKQTVEAYLQWELPYLVKKCERPRWCELVLVDDEGAPIRLTGEDLTGVNQTMRFTGRIDRVDAAESGSFRVLDYKSSSVPGAGGYQDGALLQAPLYMEALEQVKLERGDRGRYRAIKKPGKPANGAQIAEGTADYALALRFAFSIPGRVRGGLFEPVMAASRKWAFYHPGIEVTRTRARLPKPPKGEDPVEWSRFHG